MSQSLEPPSPTSSLAIALARELRPHQWVKNLLLLVPLGLAHVLPWQGVDAAWQWAMAACGFVAFCLTASAIYAINDLRDLESDRAHPTKRRRPFASGALPTKMGLPLVAALLLAAAALCLAMPPRFAGTLLVYALLSCGYSFWLKQRMLVDVFVLATLYTLRLEAGGFAAGVVVSKWLLAFSIFLFVSLAFAKRYAELTMLQERGQTQSRGRNYTVDDARIIEGTGPASGYMAVLVLALYINDASSAAGRYYPTPIFLWALCPLMMYWITRVWFFARRKVLHDDPIVFAIKDRVSWLTMLGALALVLMASQTWQF